MCSVLGLIPIFYYFFREPEVFRFNNLGLHFVTASKGRASRGSRIAAERGIGAPR